MEALLEQQVDGYLHPKGKRGLGFRFPAELEARYEQVRMVSRSRQVTMTGLLSLICYDLFLFADYAKHPSVMWRCILLRIGIVTHCTLVALWFIGRQVRATIRESLVLFDVLISGAVVLAISYNLNRNDSIFSQTGFILVVFFGSLIMRQPFTYAVATSLLLLSCCQPIPSS